MRHFTRALVCASLLVVASPALASSIVTLDIPTAAAWQADCAILGFDSIPGTASFAPGTIVPRASQVAAQWQPCAGAVFSSTGGPVACVKVAGTIQAGDAQSPPNIIGGTATSGANAVIDYTKPIHLEFVNGDGQPAPTTKVGAWTDPTGSLIRLDVFDSRGRLLESAQASQGFFLGIQHDGIASATFVFLQAQGVLGFSLDDVSVGYTANPNAADLNQDGSVGGADLAILLGAWGACPATCCAADLSNDGVVDAADLAIMLGAWG